MGVHDLWPILSELCERKPLTYLTGKCVAVDLSGWVVEALTCTGLNTSKNPHLRNLFFRVSRLLQYGVNPIFVIEGKPPALKEAAFRARNQNHPLGYGNSNPISRPIFDDTLRQCQDLLTCLGIPCLKSSGEAEALCALLYLKGIVSGVITEDNDAFLYGADVIYRDFSIKENDSHVNVYCLKSEKNKLKLSREKLVALALLLGCDYVKGVPGIGKVNAVNLISELDHENILQRFKDWKNLSESELFPGLENHGKKSAHCNRCGHLGSQSKHKKGGCPSCNSEITCYLSNPDNPCNCQWHVIEGKKQKWKTELKIYNSVKKDCPDFPNEKVIEEYLDFNDSLPSSKDLKRTCPNVEDFQNKTLHLFGWTFENSWEKVLPLVTAWQQYQRQNDSADETDFIYEPVEILKEHNLRGITFYDVQWKGIEENDKHLNFPTENLITKEYGDQFEVSYKKVVEEYNRIIAERKEKREANNKSKKFKADTGNRKVKSQTTLHDVNSSDQKYINSTASSNDSFNGLLDIPLWERIKLIPKPLIEEYKKSADSDVVLSPNGTINLLLNGSDFSETFSPLPKNFSSEVKSGKKCNRELNCSFNGKDQNTTKQNVNEKIFSCLDENQSHCFDFSDNDSSFLSILLSQDQKDVFAENLNKDGNFAKNELLIMHYSNSSEFALDLSKQSNYSSKAEYVQILSSPAIKSPRLLYSVNQSTSTPKNNICYNQVFSSVFNSSCTSLFQNEILAKDSNLSTPKSSKLFSNVYSPLMLDSDIDIM